jgi:hypothetical protein
MMIDMEMKGTPMTIKTPSTLMPQPMAVGGGGATLHIKGEIR